MPDDTNFVVRQTLNSSNFCRTTQNLSDDRILYKTGVSCKQTLCYRGIRTHERLSDGPGATPGSDGVARMIVSILIPGAVANFWKRGDASK
jgi:hypothetical protein